MELGTSKCDTKSCPAKVQASCFSCNKLYCFQCSILHVQLPQNKGHRILDLDSSLRLIESSSAELLTRIQQLRKQGLKESGINHESKSNLRPDKLERQLQKIDYIRKQILKGIDNFFETMNLELTKMWETYLKKYSTKLQRLTIIQKRLRTYASSSSPDGANKTAEYIRGYFSEKFEGAVASLSDKSSNNNQFTPIPQSPSVQIDERVLVEISQVMCNSISTLNYTSAKETVQKGLSITQPSYLLPNITILPIFPIKRPHCYLYNLGKKNFEVQQFQNLEDLPDEPKTIMTPNGDIHIIGGVKKKDLLQTHFVFRSSTSELYKLADLPYAINPSNSLMYHNKFIYLVGGIVENGDWTRRCMKYSLEQKKWTEISSLNSQKSQQSTATFNDSIYCFGIPDNSKINMERYNIARNEWEEIYDSNHLSNPFNFASGFVAIQINETDILMLGGKRFLQNVSDKKRLTNYELSPNVYLFRPQNNAFVQLDRQYPCLGVQFGEFSPIIFGGSVFFSEYLLSKNNPIIRWFDNLHVLQLTPEGVLQSVAILNTP